MAMLLGPGETRTTGLSRWGSSGGGNFPDRGSFPKCVFFGSGGWPAVHASAGSVAPSLSPRIFYGAGRCCSLQAAVTRFLVVLAGVLGLEEAVVPRASLLVQGPGAHASEHSEAMGDRTLPGPKPARKRPSRGPPGLGWKGEERFSVAHSHVTGLTGCVLPTTTPATYIAPLCKNDVVIRFVFLLCFRCLGVFWSVPECSRSVPACFCNQNEV